VNTDPEWSSHRCSATRGGVRGGGERSEEQTGRAKARSSVKLTDRPRLFLGGEKRLEVPGRREEEGGAATGSSRAKGQGAGGTDLDRFRGGGGEEKERGGEGEGWVRARESMEMLGVGEPNMEPRL
jgi:hypothetical protein